MASIYVERETLWNNNSSKHRVKQSYLTTWNITDGQTARLRYQSTIKPPLNKHRVLKQPPIHLWHVQAIHHSQICPEAIHFCVYPRAHPFTESERPLNLDRGQQRCCCQCYHICQLYINGLLYISPVVIFALKETQYICIVLCGLCYHVKQLDIDSIVLV